jgi:GTP-binding protein Era
VTRAGFVGVAGRPNVGKSTLVNAIVGSKVAITAERPQTTRRAVRGIATDPAGDWQIVLVDLPGVQRPLDALTQRMQRRVERELTDADVVLLLVNGEEGVGRGDRFISNTLLRASGNVRPGEQLRDAVPVVCAVNKVDRLDRSRTAAALAAAAELRAVDEVYPVSARSGEGLPPLLDDLVARLPEGPLLYPAEQRSDQPREVVLAELIREQVIRRTHQEIPHAVEVEVDEIVERDDGLVVVRAHVWVETESQKGILIGREGRMVKRVGTEARAEIERQLAAHVHLDLQVRVRESWRRDPALLDRIGIE